MLSPRTDEGGPAAGVEEAVDRGLARSEALDARLHALVAHVEYGEAELAV
jgi:hypothetical protein